jgi:biopolymer transport protein ExbD
MKKLIDDNEKEIAEINMTPFVDIVLVILIIFMATATFMVEAKIPLNLPEAETGEAKEVKENKIEITLKKNGDIFLNGKQISRSSLEKALEEIKNKNQVVVLRADKETPFEHIVFVVDKCRKAGIEKYLIETEKVE